MSPYSAINLLSCVSHFLSSSPHPFLDLELFLGMVLNSSILKTVENYLFDYIFLFLWFPLLIIQRHVHGPKFINYFKICMDSLISSLIFLSSFISHFNSYLRKHSDTAVTVAVYSFSMESLIMTDAFCAVCAFSLPLCGSKSHES